MALAVDLDYSSLQDIREEAGHHNVMKTETPSGLVNGSNTIFTVGRTYIVDRNYNDIIDVASASGDVIVYDDNIAVTVNAVNVDTGAISLNAAPATSSVMLITYAYSLLSDTKVGKYRDEAVSYVQRKLSGIVDYAAWTDTTLPSEIKTITRLYAGGLILIRDHGLNTDTENSSKDGYKKLAMAKSLMEDYITEASSIAGATSRVTVSAISDGNLFYRNTDLTTYSDSVDSEEFFMRNDL